MTRDCILIKAVKPVLGDNDGLVDPDQYEDKDEWGEVLAVGPGRITEYGNLVPMSVEVGDTVTFGKYSSYKTRIAGIDYLIIRDDDVTSRYGK